MSGFRLFALIALVLVSTAAGAQQAVEHLHPDFESDPTGQN